MSDVELRKQVQERYAAAAVAVTLGRPNNDALSADGCCGSVTAEASGCCSAGTCAPESVDVGESFGAGLYGADEQSELPPEALAASLGCGNPLAVAELRPGETVLDLGSGGGIDVLLSARRVGASGFAYGVDMTDEMLALARANAQKAGIDNVEFIKGTIEDVPLPPGAVDVVISNCVINLSTDKPAVLAEMFSVLAAGGRIGVADVVAEDHLTPADRAERGSYVGCIAGALSKQEYLDGLEAAGFVDADVRYIREAAAGMHSAIVRAVKPGVAPLVAAAHRGDLDAAAAAAQAAVAAHEASPLRPELARSLLVLGQIQRRRKARRQASDALGRAHDLATTMGHQPRVAEIERELPRVAGLRSRSSLTATEQRVAELIANGATNRDAATALFVSVRTIESHVATIYRKLGVHSRAELARRFARTALPHDVGQ